MDEYYLRGILMTEMISMHKHRKIVAHMTAVARVMAFQEMTQKQLLTDNSVFPINALPRKIRKTAEALSRKYAAPIELCFQSMMAAISTSVQAHGNVRLPFGAVKPISVFLMSIGGSGDRKSAVDGAVTQAFREYQASLGVGYPQQCKIYEFEAKRYNLAKKDIDDNAPDTEHFINELVKLGDEPVPPRSPNLLISDTTVAGLIDDLDTGQPSRGMLIDEGAIFIDGSGMNSAQRAATTAAISNLWDGTEINKTRGNGQSRLVRGKRLSVHLMVQPEIVSKLLGDQRTRGQGFHARFLIVAPESLCGQRFYKPVTDVDEQTISEFNDDILARLTDDPLFVEDQPGVLAPKVIGMSAEAEKLWIEFHDEVEAQMAQGGDFVAIRDVASKAAENVARIATCFKLFENVGSQKVCIESMKAAIALMNYYLLEARKLYTQYDPAMDRYSKLHYWMINNWGEELISRTWICNRASTLFRSKEDAQDAIDVLLKQGKLKPVEGSHVIEGKKCKTVYQIIR
jgi:hypothetical protein